MAESRGVLCTNCGKLISSEEKTCPHCGAKRPTAMAGPLSLLTKGKLDLTLVLINVSGVLYAASILADPSALTEVDLSSIWGLLSFGSPTGGGLYLLGMTGGLAWSCDHWWTLLTATVLHGSLLHIFFNLYWLRLLGPVTQEELGPVRFLLVYFLTGASGFLLSNLWGAPPTIGASCAIFGLMGALIVYGRKRGGQFGQRLSQQVTSWALITFVISFAIPHVNNAGHIGGFIGGLAIGAIFPARPAPASRALQLAALALVVGTAAGIGLSVWKMWKVYSTGLATCG